MKRILSPATNPAGLTSLIAALYALGVGIWNVTQHRGAVDPQVIVAALAAVAALFTRQVVTPVADPHDGAARRLVPEPPALSGAAIANISLAQMAALNAEMTATRRRPGPAPDVEVAAAPEYRAEPWPVPVQPSSDPRERAAQ